MICVLATLATVLIWICGGAFLRVWPPAYPVLVPGLRETMTFTTCLSLTGITWAFFIAYWAASGG